MFKERYDHRFNLIDWDYTMRVQPEASILHFLHYSHFRDKGLAYELRECEYSEPNYTLASRMEGKSVRAEHCSIRSVAVCRALIDNDFGFFSLFAWCLCCTETEGQG